MPAVFDIVLIFLSYRNSCLQAVAVLKIELAATHEEMTLGIGANKLAFLILQLGATDGAKLPPTFLALVFLGNGFGLTHR
jgi:hypothetical protein